MRSAASVASTRAFFARKNAAAAVASYPSRMSSYQTALHLWGIENPTASREDCERKARTLRRKFNV